jgi:endonuclease/exonuclease/phosphatase family metal-dependent hydrolase
MAAALTAAPVPSAAADQPVGGTLTVLTQNAYMGVDPYPQVRVRGITTDRGTLLSAARARPRWSPSVDFPTRAGALAGVIAETRPDVVGLQEVTRWLAYRDGAGTELGSIDFLPILLTALQGQGLVYTVAAVRWNGETGPYRYVDPPAGCPVRAPEGNRCWVRLQDRDVVLVNTAAPGVVVHADRTRTPSFRAQTRRWVDGIDRSWTRGFASVDLTVHGVPVRFLTTHLDTASAPDVQLAQARQAAARARTARGAAILTGDINSPSDGSGTGTYADLLGLGFTDAWVDTRDGPGLTCCQGNALVNVRSRLRMRIDVALLRGPVVSTSARTVNDVPFREAPAPVWLSDHAGVLTTLQVG